MESIYTDFALYGSKNECARIDNVFSPISEVCDGTVSLVDGFPISVQGYIFSLLQNLLCCLKSSECVVKRYAE